VDRGGRRGVGEGEGREGGPLIFYRRGVQSRSDNSKVVLKSRNYVFFRGGDLITTSLQTVNEKEVIYTHAQFPCILSHTRALT
jgi:hypothetical protein